MLLFLVFGWLGLCGISDCLRSGQGSLTDAIFGSSLIAVAFVPLTITSSILYQSLRRKPLGRWTAIIGWIVLLAIGALGIFQVVVDPGDALWAGFPMIVFAGFLAMSILNFPAPETNSSH
jgi:hypothetical protein